MLWLASAGFPGDRFPPSCSTPPTLFYSSSLCSLARGRVDNPESFAALPLLGACADVRRVIRGPLKDWGIRRSAGSNDNMAQQGNRISWWKPPLTCAAMYGIYLLYAATLSKPELYVALGAAVIATVAAHLFGVLSAANFRPAPKDLLQAWRVPGYLLQDTYLVLKMLLRQLFGGGAPRLQIHAVPYKVGDLDDPRDGARRALVETYTTMTPNFIVLGIVPRQYLLLYHQLQPTEVPRMVINLGAMP